MPFRVYIISPLTTAPAAGEALGLELAPLQILEYETVGMAACVTSRGGLVHPQLPPDEVAALGARFGVALRHGTVNFGLPLSRRSLGSRR